MRTESVAIDDYANYWPSPQPLPDGLPPVPEFDPLLLPESLRPWIEDIAERLQCPPDYPAVGAMIALASVVGRQVGIRPRVRDDWTVVPNLWGAVVGRPGLLKSPALSEVMKPLQKLEAKAREEYSAAERDYEASGIVAKAEAKEADKRIAQAVKRGDREAAQALAQDTIEDAGEAPLRRRYLTSDTTVEALGELLRSNPRGVLIFRDELTGWLRDLDKTGREGSRSFYLEAWNGSGRYSFDRIGRGTVDIEAACVSLVGSIQPGPLGAYLRDALDGGAGDDGLLQRLQLAIWPDPPNCWRDVDRWPDGDARRSAHAVFERLDQIDVDEIKAARDDEDSLAYLRLDAAAAEVFADWRHTLEERVRSGVEAPAFEAVLAKYRSLVPSLALLTHLADAPAGGPVSEVAMLSAIAWSEYLEQHARRIYSPALDPALHAARELDKHLRAGDLEEPFRPRDCYLKGWRLLDRRGTQDALELLEDLDRVRSAPVDTGARGGRPTTAYEVNPAIKRGAR